MQENQGVEDHRRSGDGKSPNFHCPNPYLQREKGTSVLCDRIFIQVLDDSTDPIASKATEVFFIADFAKEQNSWGINCKSVTSLEAQLEDLQRQQQQQWRRQPPQSLSPSQRRRSDQPLLGEARGSGGGREPLTSAWHAAERIFKGSSNNNGGGSPRSLFPHLRGGEVISHCWVRLEDQEEEESPSLQRGTLRRNLRRWLS